MREGQAAFLDRLGDPFLFAEEGVQRMKADEKRRFRNTLPKVIFYLDGGFRHAFDDEPPILCGPGHVMILLRDAYQTYLPARADRPDFHRTIRLTFNPELLQKTWAQKNTRDEFLSHVARRLPRQAMLPPPASPLLPDLIHAIRREIRLNRSGGRQQVNALLRVAVLELIRSIESRPEAEVPLLERIESFLENNLNRPITLAEVAQQVDRSEEHVARFYREQRATTVFRELRRRRIEKAKYYLLCSDLSVTDIAEQSGFSSVALFSRAFRQDTGKCPTDFRLKNPGL